MKILFVHQNMPGQYREILRWLLKENARLKDGNRTPHQLVFLTQREKYPAPEGVTKILYKPHRIPQEDAYALSKVWESATGVSYGAMRALHKHEEDTGFRPDIVVGHTGWGELLFIKQLWPDVPVLGFFEYFYNLQRGIVGFDPAEPVSRDQPYLLEARNAIPYASLHAVDRLTTPTQWQADCFPGLFRERMYVCHDGIRTDALKPRSDASLKLDSLRKKLTRSDEVLTYITRNTEPVRGFHIIMRALPKILKARPNARVVIVGGSSVSYGRKSKTEGGFRAEMEVELGDQLDWSRVHFVGNVSYNDFKTIVQISRCHVYLTMPFVVSWSFLEAMSMQATIVASDVAPVREVMSDGETGLLVDFFDVEGLAQRVIEVLANPSSFSHLGHAARRHIVEKYDFKTVCLPRHVAEINALVGDSDKGLIEI